MCYASVFSGKEILHEKFNFFIYQTSTIYNPNETCKNWV
jgi:hypothetical protein